MAVEKRLTTEQAGEALAVSAKHVRTLCQCNLLRHETLPPARPDPKAKRRLPRYRIPESAIAEYLNGPGLPLNEEPGEAPAPVKRVKRNRGPGNPDWSSK